MAKGASEAADRYWEARRAGLEKKKHVQELLNLAMKFSVKEAELEDSGEAHLTCACC